MTGRCLVLPVWADLEDVHGMAFNGISDVKLWPYVLWGPSLLQEPLQGCQVARALNVGECHSGIRFRLNSPDCVVPGATAR